MLKKGLLPSQSELNIIQEAFLVDAFVILGPLINEEKGETELGILDHYSSVECKGINGINLVPF